MRAVLTISRGIDRVLGVIAACSGWLLVALMALTCFDVVCRKIGVPLPYTKLQEFEWHLHTAIFAGWLGFNYTINAHPRVDSYVENLSLRSKAWIELAGCLLFALPYIAAVLYFGFDFVQQSWLADEHSESAAGLPYRWAIKSVLYAGVALVLLAIVSVILKLVAVLFGGRSAEEAQLRLGPAASEV
jgi:TRAP-type mannitol/chloroaromatic compound transport system permease small subunit